MADEQTNIRLPAMLKRRLEDQAREGRRTFTAEVVSRLERTFAEPEIAVLRDQILKERAAFNEQLQEVKRLESLVDATARAAELMDFAAKVLAAFIGELEPVLTEEQRKNPGIAARLKYAKAFVQRDAPGLAESLGLLFGLEPGEVGRLKDMREDDPPESLRALFQAAHQHPKVTEGAPSEPRNPALDAPEIPRANPKAPAKTSNKRSR